MVSVPLTELFQFWICLSVFPSKSCSSFDVSIIKPKSTFQGHHLEKIKTKCFSSALLLFCFDCIYMYLYIKSIYLYIKEIIGSEILHVALQYITSPYPQLQNHLKETERKSVCLQISLTLALSPCMYPLTIPDGKMWRPAQPKDHKSRCNWFSTESSKKFRKGFFYS